MNKSKVLNGIDNIDKYTELFKGKRLGLVTNPTGVNKNFKSTIDVLYKRFNLMHLYSPEHGIRGNLQAGDSVGTYIDEKTGITVHSLYGENKKPSKAMIEDIDAMIFDIQDVGSRYYTFIYTMGYCMEACAENNKEFIVLDRINVVGGEKVEGNILNPEFSSFVGLYSIPIRYGLTSGELAMYLNKEFNINCNLEVVPIEGWNRCKYFDQTDLLWINPSPNMPSLESSLIYNGTCLFEGTNVSEGRGTTRPFEFIGAPWIDGEKLSHYMNNLSTSEVDQSFERTSKIHPITGSTSEVNPNYGNIPEVHSINGGSEKYKPLSGVKFRPIYFKPTFSKYAGEVCEGVQVHVTDKKSYNAVDVGIYMLSYIVDNYKNKFEFITSEDFNNRYFIDLLAGTDELRYTGFIPEEILSKWHKDSLNFEKDKEKYHIYK